MPANIIFLCYQAIPFVMDFKLGRVGTSITSAILVVSPLVSLMVDQVEDLRRRKVKTSLIISGSDLAKRSAEPTVLLLEAISIHK